MKLVEKHLIKVSKQEWSEIDSLCFLSKNLYNCAIYQCRQAFFNNKPVPSFNQLYHLLKATDDYKALPTKVSQLIIKQVAKIFKSYFAARCAYSKDSSKFQSQPQLPRYKHKNKGRNILSYNYQAVSKKALKQGLIQPSGTSLSIPTKCENINEVRVIPKGGSYVIEVVYEVEEVQSNNQEPCRIAGGDIGIDNLACVTSNIPEFQPFIVCGKALKSANRYYNKVKARLQSLLPENQRTSNRIQRLTQKRNSKVDYYLHTASRYIVNRLLENKITMLVIGKNDNWKQNVNLGKKTNQKFTSIPHAIFINQLIYKCQLVGIKVVTVNEAYTSKCSFFDLEPIQKQTVYLGKRIKRGLFRASNGRVYNCDSNGSLNCIRNAVGDSVFDRQSVKRLVVSPVRTKPYQAMNSHI
ncbi:transposase [Hyella patelloides LEGE 07179]|uniref:Transposase n=1 Tax=Hyella patelloides LEGE 07179 TaxID=945734 RepID=A0A563VN39_9CYAN|nr:RNA-guided endonuclease TnpB family protein [Hyella patelloides]VEP12822.1 transposase [Hyella patelloides LEGE 07179]